MSRRVAAVGLAVVIVALVVGPIAVQTGPVTAIGSPTQSAVEGAAVVDDSPGSDGDRSTLLQRSAEDFDRTLFSVRVFENGSARWTFQYTRLLENETEEATFEGYAAEFRSNQTALAEQFRTQAVELTRFGSNATGRSMNATAFAKDARVTPLGDRGIVELSFTWRNFGELRDGGGVLVSDVFEGGLYIRSDQRLRFVAGPNLAFEGVEPSPTDRSAATLPDSEWVAWAGERSFADRRPSLSLQPAAAVRTTADGGIGDGSGTTESVETQVTTAGGDGASPGLGLLVTIVALSLVALGVVVAAWLNGSLDTGSDGAATGTAGDSGGGPTGGTAAADTEGTNAALLSDEDRVRELLEDNGGRMKQTEIVDATEWSKSKVSMLLSEMEEEGTVTKLRVGRENIISLPGEEPAAARSPFEDEE